MFNTNAFISGFITNTDGKVLICDLEGTTIPKEPKRIENNHMIKDFPFSRVDIRGDR